MNLKKFTPLLLLPVLAATSSCSTTRYSTAKPMNVYNGGIVQMPLAVDLDVQEQKVQATASASSVTPLEAIKKEAVAAATKKASADVLVEPSYDITKKGKTVTVEVSGHPGTYKNFRPLKETDFSVLTYKGPEKSVVLPARFVDQSDMTTNANHGVTRKSAAAKIIGTIGAVLLIVLVVSAL